MNLSIDPAAKDEMRQAADWYEVQSEGLGLEFLATVNDTIEKISRSPERFPQLEILPQVRSICRALVHRFPYTVIFEQAENEIRIWAVAHTSRRPNYWEKRRH